MALRFGIDRIIETNIGNCDAKTYIFFYNVYKPVFATGRSGLQQLLVGSIVSKFSDKYIFDEILNFSANILIDGSLGVI